MSAAQGPHSLAFRVMRLCRPSLHVESPLSFDPADLFVGEDIFDDPVAASELPRLFQSQSLKSADSDLTYRSRLLLHDPFDATGLSGLLVLPQSFGAIYLGETFCSYVSINNSSNFEVRDVVIKAEIQTERQKVLLLDTSKSPVESIRAGGRYDFIVEHDIKELGAHTLVCSALYNDGGSSDRKYLPQYFKFIVANPLSVRTKDTSFLEACIENHTKSDLFMDQVEFQPAQHWSSTVLKAGVHHSQNNSIRNMFRPPILVRSGGGIHNFLYQLKLSTLGTGQAKVEGSNILGKLQITWRTNLGEPGRLQTQQILGSPIPWKEIDLQVVKMPSVISVQIPFVVQLSLTNQTDRTLGPFEVELSGTGTNEEKAVMINGLHKMVLPPLEASSSIDFHLNLIADKLGVQKIPGLTIFDSREKKTYESLLDFEFFVDSD
ncbi:hypothetical protein Nepgr_032187 [Nepenthes gracilis]|uniref:Trafficking protein particle complex subunit 13 n=1 Tax=Nepenthes gracilis TaxID=150966 RepID=A0AAD3Y7P4_NEPGR|nr:hypothetical protein Nepgr_032187 [Nepenthes gracilis]